MSTRPPLAADDVRHGHGSTRRVAWFLDAARAGDDPVAAAILRTLDVSTLRDLCLQLAKAEPIAPRPQTISLDAILELAVAPFQTTAGQVLAGDRHKEVLDARHVACYAAHLLNINYSAIGRYLGRDHASVMNGCGRVGETPRLRHIAEHVARELGWDREDETA